MADNLPSSAEEIQCLLDEERYNPAIIPQLEAYVLATTASTYDLDASLALLKFYQFDPSKTNIEAVTKVLLMALMQLPSSDFQLCLYLIPEAVQEEQVLQNLMELSNLLETCDFLKFWEAAKAQEKLLASIPEFLVSVQRFVLVTLSISYLRVPKPFLCAALNVQLADLKSVQGLSKFCETFDEASETVVFKKNDQNQIKPKASEQVEDFTTVFNKVLYSSAMTASGI